MADTKVLYSSSENGGRSLLVREFGSDRAFVRHEADLVSGAKMEKQQAGSPDGRSLEPRFHVKVERLGKQPTPWTWAILGWDRDRVVQQSTQFYRSADEAWESGRATLIHLHPTQDRTGFRD
jgi:hypothetical protein